MTPRVQFRTPLLARILLIMLGVKQQVAGWITLGLFEKVKCGAWVRYTLRFSAFQMYAFLNFAADIPVQYA